MNSFIEAVQNWIDPLPAPKNATDLEEARSAVMQIDSRFDVSIEWIQHLDGQGGQYVVRPVRENCCSIVSAQKPANAKVTREVMISELRDEFEKNITMLTRNGVEDPQHTIARFNRYFQKIKEEPEAPVDRDFLIKLFSEHHIEDVTPHVHETKEVTPLIGSSRTHPSAPLDSRPIQTESRPLLQTEPHEPQQTEIRELVTLLNFINESPSSDSWERIQLLNRILKNQKEYLDRANPDTVTRSSTKSASTNKATINANPTTMLPATRLSFQEEQIARKLSKKTIQLISTIRGSSKNWINASLEDKIPMTFEIARGHINH